jgi:hypothetical protein
MGHAGEKRSFRLLVPKIQIDIGQGFWHEGLTPGALDKNLNRKKL